MYLPLSALYQISQEWENRDLHFTAHMLIYRSYPLIIFFQLDSVFEAHHNYTPDSRL